MDRLLGVGLALTLAAVALPTSATAQASLFVSGGLTVPTGDYGEYANAGWMGTGGVVFSVGTAGLGVGAAGFYGSNSHEEPLDGDKTNLYGALAFASYTMGDAAALSPYVFAGPGYLTHAYKPETGSDESGSGLALAGGVGVNVPLGSLMGFVEGMYLTGLGDEVDGTDLFEVNVGVSFPLGG
jgi:hypothetical protein